MNNNKTAERIAERLRSLRISKNMTLTEVAKQIGRSASALSGYETGRRFPDPDTLLKLLAFYDVENVGDFWGLSDCAGDDLSPTERKLISLWRDLDADTQPAVLLILEKLMERM